MMISLIKSSILQLISIDIEAFSNCFNYIVTAMSMAKWLE